MGKICAETVARMGLGCRPPAADGEDCTAGDDATLAIVAAEPARLAQVREAEPRGDDHSLLRFRQRPGQGVEHAQGHHGTREIRVEIRGIAVCGDHHVACSHFQVAAAQDMVRARALDLIHPAVLDDMSAMVGGRAGQPLAERVGVDRTAGGPEPAAHI